MVDSSPGSTCMFAERNDLLNGNESLFRVFFIIVVCWASLVKGHFAFWKLVSAKATATMVMLNCY